ncbi:MAG: U32 family peptidase [Lachnospiraceae bacterium]|nr:U32 family peptidase [Lachnospiraceae bacterium]
MVLGRKTIANRHAGAKRIYAELSDLAARPDAIERAHAINSKICAALPYIIREDYEDRVRTQIERLITEGVDGWLVRNLEELYMLKELNAPGVYIADYSLYSMNTFAKAELYDMGIDRLTAPLEENFRELKERGLAGDEIIAYGRVPLMISAQCILKTLGRCRKETGAAQSGAEWLYLKDRKGMRFPVEALCNYCCNIIYNSLPISLYDALHDIIRERPDALRLVFTTESSAEEQKITGLFRDLLEGRSAGSGPDEDRGGKGRQADFTRGHFKRGVE